MALKVFAFFFRMFSLERVVVYTLFMIFPLPEALAKNLVKTLAKTLSKNQVNILGGSLIRTGGEGDLVLQRACKNHKCRVFIKNI